MSPAVLPQAFNLLALLPEIALLLAACIVLLADAITTGERGLADRPARARRAAAAAGRHPLRGRRRAFATRSATCTCRT